MVHAEQPVIILGAGVAGLRCGQHLSEQKKVILLEKRKHVGGLATSFKYKDFIFDVGPHKIYSILPGIMHEYKELLGEDCLIRDKKNSIHLLGKTYHFPIKPFELIKQARPFIGAQCALSYAATFAKRASQDYIISYEDYFLNGFGRAAYELLFKDVAQKVWGDPKTLSADLAERRIPLPSISKLIQSIFQKQPQPEVSAKQFYYPKQGLGTVCERMQQKIKQNRGFVFTETIPTTIAIDNDHVTELRFMRGKQEMRVHPETLISTIHLIDLITIIKPSPPQAVIDAVKKLKYRSLIIVYLIIKKPRVLDDHWIFFPEKEYIFTRVAENKNFSPHTAPADKTALTAEVGCEFKSELYNLPEKELVNRVIKDLEKANIIRKEDVEEFFTVKINRCYPVYDIGYKENLNTVLDYLDTIDNLYVIGRQGLFNYNNTDHSIDMANKLANHLITNKPKEHWKQIRKTFDDYRIVD